RTLNASVSRVCASHTTPSRSTRAPLCAISSTKNLRQSCPSRLRRQARSSASGRAGHPNASRPQCRSHRPNPASKGAIRMADYLVSCDAGNGGTNAVMALDKGRYRSVYFPSVRAAATGASLGLGKDLELDYTYVDWYSHRYVVGEDVLRVTRRHMERHMGKNRYGNEMHQFLVAVALAQLGIRQGGVDLTLFAPPGMYLEAKQLIEQRFGSQDGSVEITLKGERKPRRWTYERLTVWPEGIGAVACFILDDNGDMADSDMLDGETVGIAAGAYTLDALKLVNGNFNPEALEFATWEDGGVKAHILDPILRTVRQQGEDFSLLTADDVDRVIRLGLV